MTNCQRFYPDLNKTPIKIQPQYQVTLNLHAFYIVNSVPVVTYLQINDKMKLS